MDRKQQTSALPGGRLIRLPEVKRRTGLSRTTIWREMRKGKFPKSVATSVGTRSWVEGEVEDWAAALIAARAASLKNKE